MQPASKSEAAHPNYGNPIDTLRNIRRDSWYPTMDHEVKIMIRNCRRCRAKRSTNREMPLKPHRDDTLFLNSHFALDPVTLEGEKSYLILVGRYSGYPFVYGMKDCTLQSIMSVLTQHFFTMFSCCPVSIRTDAGKQLDSDVWKAFCKSYGANMDEICHQRHQYFSNTDASPYILLFGYRPRGKLPVLSHQYQQVDRTPLNKQREKL